MINLGGDFMQHTEIELNRELKTTLELYTTPKAAKLPLIFVVPGGGYTQFQDKDSNRVALSFVAQGFQAAVVRYPIGDRRSYAASKETVQQAVDYVAEHADELGVDLDKLGMLGFSAGGQIVAEYSTHTNNPLQYVLLGYPVLSQALDEPLKIQSEDVAKLVSNQTLPTFLFGSVNDTVTPYEKHIGPYTQALAASQVPFELHEYSTGKHGISLANDYVADQNNGQVYPEFAQWFPLAVNWLQTYIK